MATNSGGGGEGTQTNPGPKQPDQEGSYEPRGGGSKGRPAASAGVGPTAAEEVEEGPAKPHGVGQEEAKWPASLQSRQFPRSSQSAAL